MHGYLGQILAIHGLLNLFLLLLAKNVAFQEVLLHVIDLVSQNAIFAVIVGVPVEQADVGHTTDLEHLLPVFLRNRPASVENDLKACC